MVPDSDTLSWTAREQEIEQLLPGRPLHDRRALLARLDEYGRAALAAARAESGPVLRTPACPQEWLDRPVFVGGAHRSGTTLMQSLLDGHPDIVVLPSEATYLSSFGYVARTHPRQPDIDRFIVEWIARLVDPNDEPHFKLGRCSPDRCPAVEFSRAILQWTSRLQRGESPDARFRLLLALVAAYHEVSMPDTMPRMWVEKTPLNEGRASFLLRTFEHARFIQVIRNPSAAYASHSVAYIAENLDGFDRFGTVRALRRSLRLAHRNLRQWGSRYLVVRYEDLTDNLEQEMGRVSEFLGIKPDPTLLCPTAAGIPVQSNSSFEKSSPGVVGARRAPGIEPRDAKLIAALSGFEARMWGYSVPRVSVWERFTLELRNILDTVS